MGSKNRIQKLENSCKSEVSQSSQNSRAALLRIGEVEDAKSIDELITSASVTGDPILDFENVDVIIASGLRKIQTGNFKKQVTTAEGKAQSAKRSLASRQVAWVIYDFFNISGDNEAILDFRDLSKAQLKSDNVQTFDTKWDEEWSAVTDRLTALWRSLYKMQVEKSEELKYVLQVFAQKDDIWRQEVWPLKIVVDGPKTSRAETQRFSLQSERTRRRQTCNWSSEQRENEKKKQINCNKNNSERVDCTRWTTKGQRSFGEAFRVQAWPAQEMQREETTLFTFSYNFTHQNLLVKVRQEKRTDDIVQTSIKRSCQSRNKCKYWHVPECTNSKHHVDAHW